MLNETAKKKIDSLIRESIHSILAERRRNDVRKRVERIVNEEVSKYIKSKINESESSSAEIKRKSVMNALKDNKFNHAELARQLWHPKDQGEEDTCRSLFSKKANGTPYNDGAVRHFTDAEITKLYELIRKR